MPAPVEVRPRYNPEPHIALASDGLVVISGEPTIDRQGGSLRVPRAIIPAAMIVPLVALACGPRPATLPEIGDAPAVGAVGISTPVAGGPEASAPAPAGPAEAGGEPPKSEKPTIPLPSEIPDHLDSISNSINAIQQPLDQGSTQENFTELKAIINRRAQAAKDALSRGDTEAARKALRELKAGVREIGDPLKARFISKEIRDQIDPQGLVLKRTDSVDPAVMDQYLGVVKVELALSGSSGKG